MKLRILVRPRARKDLLEHVAIDVGANEDVVNNTGNPELDGHYADDVSVEIVPKAPSTSPTGMMLMAVLLLVPGACLLRKA